MRKGRLSLVVKLLGLVKPLIHIMLLTITLGVIGFLSSIFISILGGYAILNIFGLETGISSSMIAAALILLVVVSSVGKYLEQLSGHYIAFKLLAVMRDKVFGALRKLAPAKLESKDRGNMISIITADIEQIEVFYAHTIAPVSIAIICSAIMACFIGTYHYSLGIIALVGYLIVGFCIPFVNTKTGSKTGREYRIGFGNLNSYILESLRGLREIIQYGQGEERRRSISIKSLDLSRKNKRLKNREGNVSAVTDLVILASGLATLATSIHLVKSGLVGIDAVVVCTIAMLGSFGPVVALSNLSNDLLQTLASGERVIQILEEEPAVKDITDKEDVISDSFKEIKCDRVSFSYGEEKVLDRVSLNIPGKKILGIYGASGSGKSTLLKLVMRFWETDKGSILFNDGKQKDINNINTRSLRKMESYVTQETHLFHDSIANNIRIAKLDATDEEVIAAAKKASIHDFISSLPNGYNTQVSELGSSLSGGEKQRIGLARAFLHGAPVMLLDEPTSNLDSLNEAIILKSLKEECEGKSVILVSHRKSTMSISDVIYEMKRGKVS